MAARFVFLTLFIYITSCSHKEPEKVQLFYGKCQLEVKSSVKNSEILIDGIEVGHHGYAMEQVPCGERQVRIHSHGYESHVEYINVSQDHPATVDYKMEKEKNVKNYALSDKFIDDIKQGKFSEKAQAETAPAPTETPAVDPSASPAEVPAAPKPPENSAH
jgi:hypothetical protein